MYANSIQLYTLTPQTIYSEYTFPLSGVSNDNIDFSPSGNQAVVAAQTSVYVY